jgi:hypothetical protein
MQDVDGHDDWEEIEALDEEHAAELYAQKCDENSIGGEIFHDSWDMGAVYVRAIPGGNITPFNITIDYEKVYYAKEAKNNED